MATSFRSFTFVCLLLLSIQQVAHAVICYSCEACASVNSLTTTTSNDYCYKTKNIAIYTGVIEVSRGGSDTCTESSTTVDDTTISTYCCSTDKCNGGVALPSSLGLAFSLAAAVIAVKWMTGNN